MARQQRGRPIDGILLLDKPLHFSSNQALQVVKAIYFAQKAGHTGSLDPLATGMLPLCFGEATKFSSFFLDADKVYYVVAQFGSKTSTGDKEGEVIEQHDTHGLTLEQIEPILETFRGDTLQIPSMYSALKHQGQPLYKLARQGIEVEREARPITIHRLTVLEFDDAQKTLTFEVHCSKGTYIRNLVEDIGTAVGCCAHVSELRRVSVGQLLGPMVTLDALQQLRDQQAFAELDALVLPLSALGQSLPSVQLSAAALHDLQHGRPVTYSNSDYVADANVALHNSDGHFMGLGCVDASGILRAKRLLKQ